MGNIAVIFCLGISTLMYVFSKDNWSFFENNFWLALGQISAIWGVTLMGLGFVMSARFRWIEKYFGGLDKVYKWHHIWAGSGGILLMIHPLSLALRRVPNYELAINTLLPSIYDINRTLGITALTLMIVLLIMTLLIKLPYRIWLTTHQWMGLVLLLGGLHVVLIGSDVSRFWPLKWWLLMIIITGLSSFAYRKIFYKYLGQTKKYVIKKIIEENGATTLVLEPIDKKLEFVAGQFAFFKFLGSETKESHPFTMISPPGTDDIRIGVKVLGDFTNKIGELRPGSKVEVWGPFGMVSDNFRLKKDAVLIAGGIGVTPFLSMMQEEADNPKDRKIDMFYSVRNNKNNYGDQILREVEKNLKQFRYYLWDSEEMGRLTVENVISKIEDYKKRWYFLCGPTQMMVTMRTELINSGVNQNHIVYEDFDFKLK